jgi:lipopolysaccharide export system protein LptC
LFKRLPALFPILIAALLALATYWLQFVVSNERPAGLGNDRGDPDTIIEHFHVDKFNVEGRLAMNLDADQLLHFPKDDSADLTNPRVRFLSNERDSHWSSDKGRVTEHGDHILLQDNVRGERAATSTAPEQLLTSSEAALQVNDEIARFDKPLTFTQGTSRIDAGAGEWNNIEGLLKLHQVDATFPRKQN